MAREWSTPNEIVQETSTREWSTPGEIVEETTAAPSGDTFFGGSSAYSVGRPRMVPSGAS